MPELDRRLRIFISPPYEVARSHEPHKASPAAISNYKFPAGSIGPKVDAACHFATKTGKVAAIGALADIGGIVRGEKGTLISTSYDAMTWHG